MADYLAKLENLADQCAIAGYLIEDEDLAMHALARLESEYDLIMCSITTHHTNEKLALKEVYSLLLNQEARIQQHHAAIVINNPSAYYYAKNGGQSGNRGRVPIEEIEEIVPALMSNSNIQELPNNLRAESKQSQTAKDLGA
ncbi:hypothetical protein TorRG33x02_017410 [Trema orientale]|uniref:Uncharacterized protein n=1 Tax=Trema orientale TaxID=63057 RepID=A0A2P5FY92_TREOI|nr:hypothetical protein TorRG33x02_017410 [Trema orientale]